ncbi:MAG: ISAzo13 family transposase, partial [Pseudomonadota bacterium]
ETVLKFIRTTKTSAGFKIRAALHTQQYQKGIRIFDKQMEEINLKQYTQRPNWNYSISPAKNVN